MSKNNKFGGRHLKILHILKKKVCSIISITNGDMTNRSFEIPYWAPIWLRRSNDITIFAIYPLRREYRPVNLNGKVAKVCPPLLQQIITDMDKWWFNWKNSSIEMVSNSPNCLKPLPLTVVYAQSTTWPETPPFQHIFSLWTYNSLKKQS